MNSASEPKVDLAEFLADGGDLESEIAKAEVVQIRGVPRGKESPPEFGIFVRERETWERTDDGCHRLAPYALRVDRDVRSSAGRRVEGVVQLAAGRTITFDLPAEVLGDVRALRKTLAGLLGSDFRAPRGKLERMLDAWLDASETEYLALGDDFGFSQSGEQFLYVGGSIPAGETRFGPPADSPAARLELRVGDPIPVIAELLDVWPPTLGCPQMAGALLGLVGFAVVTPVLEARDPGVAPLLACLHGPSGAGKTTHAGVVQGFFGAFTDTKVAMSLQSTALAIELEAFWFRGAVMTAGDGKEGTLSEESKAKLLGLIQRAGDRAVRRRLTNSGAPQPARPSRATLLFEGEDLPVTEGSGLARLLVLSMPKMPIDFALLHRLEMVAKDLPIVTRALVEFLIRANCWDVLVDLYRSQVERLYGMQRASSNLVRLSKSIAAVAVGLRVWSDWLRECGLAPPCTEAELVDFLVESLGEQVEDVEAAKPGEYFLELVRQLLASGSARLGEADEAGVVVGVWKDDKSIAYILDDAVLGQLRRHFPDAARGLSPKRSIARDLKRMDALAEHDNGRLTKKWRVKAGEAGANTWAIRAEFLE